MLSGSRSSPGLVEPQGCTRPAPTRPLGSTPLPQGPRKPAPATATRGLKLCPARPAWARADSGGVPERGRSSRRRRREPRERPRPHQSHSSPRRRAHRHQGSSRWKLHPQPSEPTGQERPAGSERRPRPRAASWEDEQDALGLRRGLPASSSDVWCLAFLLEASVSEESPPRARSPRDRPWAALPLQRGQQDNSCQVTRSDGSPGASPPARRPKARVSPGLAGTRSAGSEEAGGLDAAWHVAEGKRRRPESQGLHGGRRGAGNAAAGSPQPGC